MACNWASRSLINALRLAASRKVLERSIAASRLRTSWAALPTPSAAARARRNRRWITALPALTSISSSANTSGPRAARFWGLRVRLLAITWLPKYGFSRRRGLDAAAQPDSSLIEESPQPLCGCLLRPGEAALLSQHPVNFLLGNYSRTENLEEKLAWRHDVCNEVVTFCTPGAPVASRHLWHSARESLERQPRPGCAPGFTFLNPACQNLIKTPPLPPTGHDNYPPA